jgi:uncharacterized protein
MRKAIFLCLLLCSPAVMPQAQPDGQPIVFFTIFGPQAEPLQRFYRELFGWKLDGNGRFDAAVAAPFSGQIVATTPGAVAEALFYIGVPDVTATLTKATALGGTIRYPRFEVPGVAVLGALKDPAGNSIGLVEMENGKAKVPRAPARAN